MMGCDGMGWDDANLCGVRPVVGVAPAGEIRRVTIDELEGQKRGTIC